MSASGALLPKQDAVACPLAAKADHCPRLARTLSGPLFPEHVGEALHFDMHVDPAWMKRIDDWRRKQDDLNRPGLVGGHLV